MNKDIISKLLGIDIHLLTLKGDVKTISYENLINVDNAEIDVENINRSPYFPFYLNHYKFDLHMECDGYTYKYSDGATKNIGKNGMIIPKILDVNIIVPDKVVEATFVDGTKEKSVCREPDTFSLESAISICISKKIMGGSSAYNNAVKRGMKVYEDKQKKEATEKAEQERIEKKRAKRLAYKECRAAKRAEEENQRKAREREEQIEIQTEAYLRAMDIMKSENKGA